MSEPLEIIFLLGCTACGKGAVGRGLAARIDAEIVSVDSMKVYRRMDIGTGKPSAEVRATIPHHLLDVAEPSESFSAARFVELAEAVAVDIVGRGKRILAVGGTSLYIKAWSEGLFAGPSADPELRSELHARAQAEGSAVLHAELVRVDPVAAERIHRNDLRRIVRSLEVYKLTGTPLSELQTQWNDERVAPGCTFIGLRRILEDQNRRTNARVKRMIEAGLVDEVAGLLAEDPPMATTPRQAVGYAEIIAHLAGELSLAEAVERIKINTRQFAKAQRTWSKRFRSTRWLDVAADESADSVADRIVAEL